MLLCEIARYVAQEEEKERIMTTKASAAIILLSIAFAMIGQSGAYAQQLDIGLPTRTITMPTPAEPAYEPQAVTTDAPEFRAVWADAFGNPGPFDPVQISTIINGMYYANYNALVMQVRKTGDAYYNSKYEFWATNISKSYPGFDPLGDALTKAHAKGIKFHAWFIPFRIWNPVYPLPTILAEHPEYAMVTIPTDPNAPRTWMGRTQVGSDYWLDPGIPAVQQYTCDVVMDCLEKYDVDGINFDRIRYPEGSYWYTCQYNPWGYSAITRERFNREYGYYPPTTTADANWNVWCDFRRQQITDLMRKIYMEMMSRKPNTVMSADTIGWMGVDPSVDFTGTQAYKTVYQDSKKWMNEHFLDLNILMNYKREHYTSQQADYRLWANYLATLQTTSGRQCVSGPAAYLNHLDGTIAQIQYNRSVGLAGSCTYNYRMPVPTADGVSVQTALDTFKAAVFQNPAPVPEMPWKTSPTVGILFGQVTDSLEPNDAVYGNWLCKAQVTAVAEDATTYTTTTDGTGTYGFIDLPPGTYTVSAGMSQYGTGTGSGTVTAGGATKLSFQIGSLTEGYLFGQVSDVLSCGDWLDEASVTAVGPTGNPSTYQTQTDDTGTYGFRKIPPGDYAITVSKTGHSSASNPNKAVVAGAPTRVDFTLGPALASEDYVSIADAVDSTKVADNKIIGLLGKVVTVAGDVFPGCIYLEEPDRSSGIQIRFCPSASAPPVVEGERVDFIGLASTINGERMLTHAAMQSKTTGSALSPLQSSVRDLDRGPNSTALLMQCAGKVADTGVGWFTVDDGSGVVKVLNSGLIGPARNAMVRVSGISGYESERIIRAWKQADIVVVSPAAITAPTGTIGSGFNLISLPYVPTDASPSLIFGAVTLTSNLFRWDDVNQAFVTYDAASAGAFGKLTPGEGYALLTTSAGSMAFQGITMAADTRITIPKTGWSLIAQPFTNAVLWNHVSLTDGAQTLTLQEAINAGWIGRIAFTWDTASGDWSYVGTGGRGSSFDDWLRPWHAYWITTYKDNLAIIIPAAG